jgi:hypothetical protein
MLIKKTFRYQADDGNKKYRKPVVIPPGGKVLARI